jgi:hypothetical protein
MRELLHLFRDHVFQRPDQFAVYIGYRSAEHFTQESHKTPLMMISRNQAAKATNGKH